MVPSNLIRTQNLLLATLPSDEWARLEPDLQISRTASQATLHQAHEPIDHAFFPLSGSVSLLVSFADGFTAEVAAIGNEGMVGIPLLLGQTESMTTAKVQLSGVVLSIKADTLITHLDHCPILRRNLLHYAGLQAAASMQLAACNAHHSLNARLARCLLGFHDRCQGNDLALTHDNFSVLLCAHRPSVSVSLKGFEERGLIRQGKGLITIVDRDGLEHVSCECYEVMRDARNVDGRSGKIRFNAVGNLSG